MPVYTYHCDNCGIQFDATQKFTDSHLTVCPECGKKTLRKVFTPVGIVFKGSGFYATDHRSPSGAPRSSHGEDKSSEEKKSESEKPTPAPAPATAAEKNSSSSEKSS
jgi:putative FmdB family regulatory protein